MKRIALFLTMVLGCSSASALIVAPTGATGGEAAGSPVNQDIYSVTVENAADVGSTFTLNWGFNGADAVSAMGIFTILAYDGSATGHLDLGVSLTNTSTVTGASNPRVVSFGFNTVPEAPTELTGLSVTDSSTTDTDIFSGYALNTNFPAFQTVDVCVFSHNCSGGNVNSGLSSGNTDAMVLHMTGDFSGSGTFFMSDFAMKFQGIDSYELPGQGCCTTVPEPASLALLGLGLLGMGATARRRKKS